MIKRILSVFLTLCMLLGLMPAALAEELRSVDDANWRSFTITQGDASYYHGDDIDNYAPNRTGDGYGSGEGVYEVVFSDGKITANETARHKTADILYQPFTISMEVPAYTTYTVTFRAISGIQRNSGGNSWYYQELFNGVPDGPLSTAYSMDPSDDGKTAYRLLLSDSSGVQASGSNFTATFSNMTGEAKSVFHDMVYYVGASAATSALSRYYHCITSSLEITARSCVVSTQAAVVGDTSYTELADAVKAYEEAGNATLRLLKNATGDVALTQPGTVDLGGHTVNGCFTVTEGAGETVEITNGTIVTNSSIHDAILHDGEGTLTLSGVMAEGYLVRYGVKNVSGALVLDSSKGKVTVAPGLLVRGEALTFKGGWPAIYDKNSDNNEIDFSTSGGLWLGNPRKEEGCGITLDMTDEEFAQGPERPYRFVGAMSSAASEDTGVNGIDIVTNWPEGADVTKYFAADSRLPYFEVVDADETDPGAGKKLIARCYVVTFKLGEDGIGRFDGEDKSVRQKQASVSQYPHWDSEMTKVSRWPVPRDSDLEFEGWANDEGTLCDRNFAFTKDTVLKAKWKSKPVDVTFDPNGGAWTDGTTGEKTETNGYKAAWKLLDEGKNPTRAGYTFTGWYCGHEQLITPEGGGTVPYQAGFTVRAGWEREKAAVTFHYNYEGADPASFTLTAEKGGPVGTLPAAERTDWLLEGWYTDAEGGTKITSAQTVNGGEEFYAHWRRDVKTYTVTWDANGGQGTATTQLANSEKYAPPVVTRTGYTFDGWYTKADLGQPIGTYFTKNANQTVYAHWTARNDIQVTFDAGGGSSSHEPITVTFDSPYGELPRPTHSDTAQQFIGWFTEDGKLVTANTLVSREDHTLTARWDTKHKHLMGSGEDADELTFEPLTQDLSSGGELAAGNYYLTGDITTTKTIKFASGATVNLCLNGYEIKADTITSTSSSKHIIEVGYNRTLNICDCKGGGKVTYNNETDTSSCVRVEGGSGGGANLYGGTFQGPGKGRGVYLQSGTVTVDGATLIGGKSGNSGTGQGSGLDFRTGCTATVKSGSLSGKYGAYLDGEFVGTPPVKLIVTGGSITGTQYAIYYEADDELTSDQVNEYALELDGSPTIEGNIYLDSRNAVIKVGDALQGTFSVSHGSSLAMDRYITITVPADKNNASHFVPGKFVYDAGNQYQTVEVVIRDVVENGKHVVRVYRKGSSIIPSEPDEPAPGGGHSHTVCGKAACPHGGEHVTVPEWTALTADTALTDGGSYTLEGPLTGNLTVPEGQTVNLCLNGQTLTGTVTVNGTLNLCDCKGGGTVTGNPAIKIEGGTLNQFGGTLTTTGDQPVTLDKNGTWNFHAGELALSPSGAPKIVPTGTVNLLGKDDDIKMNDGTIEFTGTDQTVHIGAKPATPYNVTESGGGKISATLPAGVDATDPNTLAEYLKYTGTSDGAPAVEDGKVVLKKPQVVSDYDGKILEIDGGKLTETQINSLGTPTKPGSIFEGWFDAPDGGDQITIDTPITANTTIYPHWTPCTHKNGEEDAVKGEPAVVEATCTAEGTKTFTCSLCNMEVVNTVAPLGHDIIGVDWTDGGSTHYKVCKRNCGERVEEAEHTWDGGTVSGGNITYTCTVCGTAKTEEIRTYKVTFEVDDYTDEPHPAETTSRAGEQFNLPTVTRTGYTLAGWVMLDAEGRVPQDGTEDITTSVFTMPARDVIFQVRWKQIDAYQPQPGETVVLEDGTTVEKKDDGTVTVTEPGGGKTTTIDPGDGDVAIKPGTDGGKDKIEIPGGSTVTTTTGDGEQGPAVTLPDGEGGTVDSSGTVDAPAGTKVETGGTTVTTGTGGGVINSDGNISFPPSTPGGSGGGTVSVTKDGETTENVPVGGDTEGMDPETGEVPEPVPENNVIQIGDTVVTLPEDAVTDPTKGGVTGDGEDAKVEVPGGSTVQKGEDGAKITVGEEGGQTGGAVKEDGSIELPPGGSVSVPNEQGGTTEIKIPENSGGGTVTAGSDGTLTAPEGSRVTETDENGDTVSENTAGPGGQPVTPGTGTALKPGEEQEIPGIGTVTYHDDTDPKTVTITPTGGTPVTTVTLPTGTTEVTVNEKTGAVIVPGGSKVQTGDDGPVITLPEDGKGGKVSPDGGVTPNGTGGSVTVGSGGNTTTVTPPTGGKVEPGNNGEVKVPGGTVVQTGGSGPEITVGPGNGGTVDPNDGRVTPDRGGSVQVGSNPATAIIPPDGESVKPGDNGKVEVPGGSKVQTEGNNPKITVGGQGGSGGTVDPDGGVTLPEGGDVTISDGKGNTEITVPGGGEVAPDGKGGVAVPGGSEVNGPKGTGTVPEGGGTVKPDGTIVNSGDQPEPDNQITLGGGNVVITPPEGTTGTKDDASDTATTPSGSTVQTGDGPEVTVGTRDNTDVTVKGDGTVEIPAPGGSVSMDGESGKIEITVPGDRNVTVEEDGVTVPSGSTVNPSNGKPEINVKDDGTKVKPDGTITVPSGGGSVSISDDKGGETEITVPGGSTVKPNPDGTITIPAGSIVKTSENPDGVTYNEETKIRPDGTPVTGGDTPGNEFTGEKTIGDTTVTVPPDKTGTDNGDETVTVPSGSTVQTGGSPVVTVETDGTTVKPDGIIEVPDGGGSVSIPDGEGGKTEITVPGGGTVEPNPDGTITIPAGSTVQTGPNGPEITVGPGNTGTVDPGTGGVTVPGGGKVSIDDDKGNSSIITAPTGGGEVKPDGKGGVTATGGSKVTKPDGTSIGTVPEGGTVKPDGSIGEGGEPGPDRPTPDDPKTYTVKFDTQGGGSAPASQNITAGGTASEPSEPTRNGYAFKGWFTNKECTAEWNFSTPVDKPMILYAKWEKNAPMYYTVNFDTNNGDSTVPNPQTLEEGKLVSKPDTPTRSGHTFLGWTRTKDSADFWQFNSDTVAGDMTLYAKWEADSINTPVPDTPMKLPGGGTVAKDPNSGEVTITDDSGATAVTITPSGGDGVAVDGSGNVTIPAAAEVTIPGGEGGGSTTIQLPSGGKVNGNGVIELPDGGKAEINGGGTTITAPDGGGTITPKPEGGVELSAGSTVKTGDSSPEITLPTGGTATPDSKITVSGGDKATISDGDGNKTEIIAPTGGGSLTPTGDGEIEVPGGSIVQTGDGPAVTVPEGSKVNNDGKITIPDGGKATIPGPGGSGSTTITPPSGAESTIAPTGDGKFEVTGGSTVKPGGGPEITVDRDVTVDPDTNNITIPDGGSATIPVPGGSGFTTITPPTGGASIITPTAEGKVEVPKGTTVTIPDGTTVTIDDGNVAEVEPDGKITIPGGGTVTITTPDGVTKPPVTVAPNGTVDPADYRPTPGPKPTPGDDDYNGYDDDDDDDDDDGGGPSYRPNVDKSAGGDVSVSPRYPKKGDSVTITTKPDGGYEVEGITITGPDGPVEVRDNGDGTYTFIQPQGKTSIKVTYRPVQTTGGYATCSRGETCPVWAYNDTNAAAWYHDGVHFCLENGLMNGFNDGTFKPNDTLSRAQLAQILYNLEGRPAFGGTSPFTDVPNDAWFANAVLWANQKGIVGGYGNGSFGPNDPITREQLAAMLWRYAQAKGRDVSVGENTNILGYKDFNQISEYAIPALQWAAGAGVMEGKGDGLLDPAGRATRAQAAVMLQRYLENTTH